ncbi:hypothetical protein WN944_003819 [Citrus x changshan-huyou]|uniref:Uncharacterized protein n=1 Tax=Citrus x changshan-huyou TaxID=2935761 RepID=A0AAP0QFT2_9ROSI
MIQYNGRSIILSWHSLPPSLDLTLPTFLYLLDNPAYYTPHYQIDFLFSCSGSFSERYFKASRFFLINLR